jgi:uncharacterized protein YkwD
MFTTTRHTLIMVLLILFPMTGTLPAQEPTGGPLSRLVGRLRYHQPPTVTTYPSTPSASSSPAQASAECECSGQSDPYGFAAILNRIRASAGLHPLTYDPELTSWASHNNAVQCRRGIGHHVNPSCVQNCGWNYSDASSVAQGWMNSPGHRQNMLSPSVSRYGLAFGPGPYWTFNAR